MSCIDIATRSQSRRTGAEHLSRNGHYLDMFQIVLKSADNEGICVALLPDEMMSLLRFKTRSAETTREGGKDQ